MNGENGLATIDRDVYVIPDLTPEGLKKLEGNVETWKKYIKIALKMTRAGDWSDQDGQPYIEGSGCEAVANPFGIEIVSQTKEKQWGEDEKGKYYIYIYRGEAYCKLSGRRHPVEGICSTRFQLFGKKAGQYRPLDEVDEVDVMTTARRKMLRNAVVETIGLRNITWEDLAEIGILRDKVAKVDHGKGTEGGAKDKLWTPETQKLADDIKIWLSEMIPDSGKICDYIETNTAFKGRDGNPVAGKRNLNLLSDKQIAIFHSYVKKDFEEWKKAQGEKK